MNIQAILQLLELLGLTRMSALYGGARPHLYLLQMTLINVYLSSVTDPLVYLLLGYRRSGRNSSKRRKTAGRVYRIQDVTADMECGSRVNGVASAVGSSQWEMAGRVTAFTSTSSKSQ